MKTKSEKVFTLKFSFLQKFAIWMLVVILTSFAMTRVGIEMNWSIANTIAYLWVCLVAFVALLAVAIEFFVIHD